MNLVWLTINCAGPKAVPLSSPVTGKYYLENTTSSGYIEGPTGRTERLIKRLIPPGKWAEPCHIFFGEYKCSEDRLRYDSSTSEAGTPNLSMDGFSAKTTVYNDGATTARSVCSIRIHFRQSDCPLTAENRQTPNFQN